MNVMFYFQKNSPKTAHSNLIHVIPVLDGEFYYKIGSHSFVNTLATYG